MHSAPATEGGGRSELGQGEPVDAILDGRRVVIDAREEIVLRCGKASITLRRNGRVIIRGTYVETDSEGVNRIKGGTVRIN
jgi:hypothetical protein